MTLLAAIVLNALWQDALLVAFVWFLLRAFPQINAATRYVVWSAALVAAVLVPAIATYASFVPARVSNVPVAVGFSAAPGASAPRSPSTRHLRVSLTMRPVVVPQRWWEIPDRIRLTIPSNVARAVVAAWAFLAAYGLFKLLLGLFRLERLKRDALPLSVEYRDAMPEWNRASKGRRAVRLCVSDAIDVPVAVGLFDSMILIPRDLLERLSPNEVEQISLHELAHLRRGDDWSNCLQRLTVAALGWNPAANFVAAQLELEREVACDDWVLSSVRSVRPYAMCLTKMAETAAWPHHPMPAPGVFTTRKQISLRIERLLASGRDIATTLSIGPAAVAVAGVAAAAFAIGMVAPSIAAPAIAPVEPVVPVARAVSPARTVPHVKPIERVIRMVRVTPAAIATPVAVASSAENMAMHMAGSAVADALPGRAQRSKSCSSCDYHGVNWAGRDLRGARYSVVDFSQATLSGTNFSQSMLNVVDFSGANLRSAAFRQARLNNCDFSQANLRSADFSGAVFSQCSFSGAQLDGANFNGARLVGCDLSGVDLHHVDLSHARIIDYSDSLKQPPPP